MRQRVRPHTRGPLVLLVTLMLLVGAAVGLFTAPVALAQSGGDHGNSASAQGQVKKDAGGTLAPAATSATTDSHGNSTDSPGHTKDSPTLPTEVPATGVHATGNAGTSGTDNSPQPVSNADSNSGGANGQCTGGPYCSTRDGASSGNGNQVQGQHNGEPCAGCVGKADNKNPKGQLPGGTDHNAGYECDSNKGIGRTNPAHTGCTTSSTSSSSSSSTSTTSSSSASSNAQVCIPTAHNAFCGTTTPPLVCRPAAANNFCSQVLGEHVSRPPAAAAVAPAVAVLGEQFAKPASSALPFTGFNAATFITLAVLLLLVGGVLAWVGRRRRRTA